MYFLNDKGYICYVNPNCSISSSHNGHQDDHARDIAQIANEIANKKIDILVKDLQSSFEPYIADVCTRIWNDVAQQVLRAFTY